MKKIITSGLVLFLTFSMAAFARGNREASTAENVRGGKGTSTPAITQTSGNDASLVQTAGSEPQESVYFIGSYIRELGNYQDEYTPCYWKNGVRHDLSFPGGKRRTLTGMATTGIFVYGSDVYIAGAYYNDANETAAGYWKNGIWHEISVPAGDKITGIGGIAVSGSDVYILGAYTRGEREDGGYWKNGTWSTVSGPANSRHAAASKIVVSGSDVYFFGGYLIGQTRYTCYWKNGIRHEVTGTANMAVHDTVLSGSDTHTAGRHNTPVTTFASYWKNGTRTELPIPAGGVQSVATSLALSGSDIYIAGHYEDTNNSYKTFSCYWKNGTRHDLPVPAGGENGEALAIAVSGSDVYVAGNHTYVSRRGTSAGYWKNGIWNTLPIPADATYSMVTRVVITR